MSNYLECFKKKGNVGGGRVVDDVDDGVRVETHHSAEQLHELV